MTRALASSVLFLGTAALLLTSGIDGAVFGLTDNLVLILGGYLGFDLGERLGEGRGRLGAVLGAAIGNTVSDSLGAILDPTMTGAILGITLGCLVPILLIPAGERLADRHNA